MKIIKKQSLMQTPFLDMVDTTYEDKDGVLRHWYWVTRPRMVNAVMIVGITDNQELLLIKEFRIPLNGVEYGFPAGLVEPGEAVLTAADRELREETGYRVIDLLRPPSPITYNTPGVTDEGISMVFARIEKVGETKLESSEEIEPLLVSKDQARAIMADKGNKIGAKCWLIMDRFITHGDI